MPTANIRAKEFCRAIWRLSVSRCAIICSCCSSTFIMVSNGEYEAGDNSRPNRYPAHQHHAHPTTHNMHLGGAAADESKDEERDKRGQGRHIERGVVLDEEDVGGKR